MTGTSNDNVNTDYFSDLLDFDPLAAAEKYTGRSYKDDEDTFELGMEISLLHKSHVRDELSIRQDTYYGMRVNDYVAVLERLGFEKILERNFTDSYDGHRETQQFWWRDGLFLLFDSSHGTVNRAIMYANVQFAESAGAFRLPLSGHYIPEEFDAGNYVWTGSMDAREALVHRVAQLEATGVIYERWIERPFLYLCHYNEDRDLSRTESSALSDAILGILPLDIQIAIGRGH